MPTFSSVQRRVNVALGLVVNYGPGDLNVEIHYEPDDRETRTLEPNQSLAWDARAMGLKVRLLVMTPPSGTTYYYDGTNFPHGIPPASPTRVDLVDDFTRELGQIDIARVLGSALSVSNPLFHRLTNGTSFYDSRDRNWTVTELLQSRIRNAGDTAFITPAIAGDAMGRNWSLGASDNPILAAGTNRIGAVRHVDPSDNLIDPRRIQGTTDGGTTFVPIPVGSAGRPRNSLATVSDIVTALEGGKMWTAAEFEIAPAAAGDFVIWRLRNNETARVIIVTSIRVRSNVIIRFAVREPFVSTTSDLATGLTERRRGTGYAILFASNAGIVSRTNAAGGFNTARLEDRDVSANTWEELIDDPIFLAPGTGIADINATEWGIAEVGGGDTTDRFTMRVDWYEEDE